jgi:hypothetical protein
LEPFLLFFLTIMYRSQTWLTPFDHRLLELCKYRLSPAILVGSTTSALHLSIGAGIN